MRTSISALILSSLKHGVPVSAPRRKTSNKCSAKCRVRVAVTDWKKLVRAFEEIDEDKKKSTVIYVTEEDYSGVSRRLAKRRRPVAPKLDAALRASVN